MQTISRLFTTPPGPPFARGGKGWGGFRWSLVLRSDHWRVTPFTPPGPPFARGGKGGAGLSLERGASIGSLAGDALHPPWPPLCKGGKGRGRGFRWSVVLRSDHWRVTPFTPLAPPCKGGKGRGRGFAGSWCFDRITGG